jgi:hypothetical protein
MKYIKIKEQSDYDENGNCAIQTKYQLCYDNKKKEIYSYDSYFNGKRDLKIYDEHDMKIMHYINIEKNTTCEHDDTIDQKFIKLIFEIFDI